MSKLISLMFHGVVPDIPDYATYSGGRTCLLRLDDFERTIQWCTQRYRIIGLAEVESFLASGANETAVLLTFDDGLATVVDYAAPVLAAYGVRATVFVTTTWTKNTQTPAIFALERDMSARLPKTFRVESGGSAVAGTIRSRRDLEGALGAIWSFLLSSSTAPLVLDARQVTLDGKPWVAADVPESREFWYPATLSELRNQVDMGVFDIGAHGATHVPWTLLSTDDLRAELVLCREQLQQWFGRPVEACSYPHGMVDTRVAAGVTEVFKLAFTSQHGVAGPSSPKEQLPRIHVPSEAPFWPEGIIRHRRTAAVLRRVASALRLS